MKTAYLWEKGECPVNEDSLVLQEAETKNGTVLLAAVCDGIGGLKEGETASGYMAEMLVVWFYKEFIPMTEKQKSDKSIYKSAVKLLYEADEKIKEYGRTKGICLGTTVTALIVLKRRFWLFHIGDSRAYKITGKMKVLTREDGDGKGLHRCIGAGKWEKPQWKRGRVFGRCAFLLCTDGFYKKLSEKEMEIAASPICREETVLKKRMGEAGEQIKRRRMQDNVSAVSIIL